MLSRMLRMTLATATMGAALWGWLTIWPSHMVEGRLLLLLWLLGCLSVAAVTYVIVCRLLRVDELSELMASLKRRTQPSRS